MNEISTKGSKQKQNVMLFFNLAVMAASFTVSLVALPQEMFFVVAVIILFALREIEKDFSKNNQKRMPMLSRK